MSAPPPPPAMSLYKQHSWSPDIFREEIWTKRKNNLRKSKSKSVTDDDLEELKACVELGFGFDNNSPVRDERLVDTLPALDFYYAVHKQLDVSRAKSPLSSSGSEVSPSCSPKSIFSPGDNPEMVKTRLKQWAQVVACSVLQKR